MEIKNRVLLLAFFITLFLFLSFLVIGEILNKERESELDVRFDEMQSHINDVQLLMLMSEIYGDQMACLGFEAKIKEFDETIWTLGSKLDQYKAASEEFQKNPYYAAQKKLFNEQEVLYLMLMKKIYEKCDFGETYEWPIIISYFYGDSKTCDKCEDQAHVLTAVNLEIDEYVSIVSFDTELDVTGVEILMDFYDVDSLPCIIINEKKFCGIRSKDFIINEICKNKDLDICKNKNIIIS